MPDARACHDGFDVVPCNRSGAVWPLGQTFPPLVPLAKTADYRGCNPKQGEVMPDKLKPCPRKDRGLLAVCWNVDRWYVFCDVCLDRGPEAKTEAGAIAAWNNRKEPHAG